MAGVNRQEMENAGRDFALRWTRMSDDGNDSFTLCTCYHTRTLTIITLGPLHDHFVPLYQYLLVLHVSITYLN